MSDLISRQAAIDAVRKLYIQSPKIKNDIVYDTAIDQAHDILVNLPSAQPEYRWIPVTERLPKKYIGQWLCCTSDGDVLILPYDTPGDGTKECVFYEWDDNGYFYQIFDVIAWMPLPEPWKGEGDE